MHRALNLQKGVAWEDATWQETLVTRGATKVTVILPKLGKDEESRESDEDADCAADRKELFANSRL
jgi:hypothetical protein